MLLFGERLKVLRPLIVKELLLIMGFEDSNRRLFLEFWDLSFDGLIFFRKSRLLADIKEIALVDESLGTLPLQIGLEAHFYSLGLGFESGHDFLMVDLRKLGFINEQLVESLRLHEEVCKTGAVVLVYGQHLRYCLFNLLAISIHFHQFGQFLLQKIVVNNKFVVIIKIVQWFQ